MKRHAPAFIVGILCAIAAAVVIDGIWRAGDAACDAASYGVTIYGGYAVTYSPCDADDYEAWLEPALR